VTKISGMQKLILLLCIFISLNINAQDDPYKGMNKKELKEYISNSKTQCELSIENLNTDISILESTLSIKEQTLNSTIKLLKDEKNLNNLKDDTIKLLESKVDDLSIQLDSLNRALDFEQRLSNTYLENKAKSYLLSWNSMCLFERIKVLIGPEFEWYKTFIPEITNFNPQEFFPDLYTDEFPGLTYEEVIQDLPTAGGGACTGLPDLEVFKINEDCFVGIAEWPGDFESTPFISLTIILPGGEYFKSFAINILNHNELYISDDCTTLVSRANFNSCWGAGQYYDLTYIDNELYGSIGINCGSDEDGYDAVQVPLNGYHGEIIKTDNSFTFTAFSVSEDEFDGVKQVDREAYYYYPGASFDLFKINKITPGPFSPEMNFNIEIFGNPNSRRFKFLENIDY